MKKTLIALTVVTGAVMSVSGVANAAFESGYTGGDFSLGGTITASEQGAVYEGKVGSVTGLDATVSVGDTSASITAPADAGLLALRSVSGGFNSSASGKIANISFNGKTLLNAASGSSFSNGAIKMKLNAYDSDGDKIGSVSFPMQVAGVSVIVNNSTSEAVGSSLYSYGSSTAYYGGLPQTASGSVSSYSDALGIINGLFSDVSEYLPATTSTDSTAQAKQFVTSGQQIYTAYAAGIAEGQSIDLTLDSAATAGDVSWTASMPVTVTYQ